jgi:outer membrane protein assembly factor BamB
MMNLKRHLAIIAVLPWIIVPLWAENWPQFRGPTGMGISTDTQLPLHWGGEDKQNIRWASPLIGEGHASPIVWGDQVFVCTVRWDESVSDRKQVIPEHHVIAYRASDGERLWDTVIEPGPWVRNDFRSGPGGGYAAPTPATDGKHIYAVFGSSVIAALDFEGKIVWRKVIEPHTFDVTIGSSPVLYKDTVIMLCAMARREDSRIIAYKQADGAIAWEVSLAGTGFGHSTPVLIEVNGQTQMIVVASGSGEHDEGVQSFDPKDGRRIWWCRGGGDASSAAYGAGIVYCDNGRGGPGIAIDPNGSGDVSKTHVKWRISQVPEAIGSPLIVDDRVYRLHRPNVLKCWRASDGTELFSQRLEGITSTWASPIADPAGRIYFASGGVSYVIKAQDTFKVLAVNELGDPNHASPAASGGRLFIAGTKQLYSLGAK